jgi:hypothetical protein
MGTAQNHKNFIRSLTRKGPKQPRLGSGERFARFANKLVAQGKSKESADAIAAAAGRKKYGAKKFSSLAAKGRKAKVY